MSFPFSFLATPMYNVAGIRRRSSIRLAAMDTTKHLRAHTRCRHRVIAVLTCKTCSFRKLSNATGSVSTRLCPSHEAYFRVFRMVVMTRTNKVSQAASMKIRLSALLRFSIFLLFNKFRRYIYIWSSNYKLQNNILFLYKAPWNCT